MKKLTLIILIIILVGAGIGFQFFLGDQESNFSTVEAEQENITEQVSVTGSLVPKKRIKLQPQVRGQVEKIPVEISDKVEKRSLLLKLEQDKAQIQVQKSKTNVNSAKQEIDLLETKLKNASSNLQQVKDTTAESVDQAQTTLESKEQNLKDIEEKQSNALEDAYENGRSALNINYLTANSARMELENIQDEYFTANDQISLKARGKLEEAENDLEQAKTVIDKANSTNDQNTTKDALNELKTGLKELKEALRYTRDEACEDPYYENQIASGVKTTLGTQKSNVETAISNVTTALQKIKTQQILRNNSINKAQSQLNSAEAALKQAESQRSQKVTQAESKVEEIKQELELKEAKLESAKSNLAQAQVNLDDTTINAPVAGTITKVNIEEGETANPGVVIVTMIPEKDYKIEANISEVNIGSIDKGDNVKVDFDAYPEQQYQGKVSKIHPAEIVKQGVIYYQIEVKLDSYPEKLKPGFTANLNVITGQRQDVVTVPYIAVREDDQGSYVQVVKDGEIKSKKRVKIGLEGDTKIEIKDGLKTGEKVLLSQE